LLGAVLGIIFGAASVYLGLRVGLTTSASIPIAVMSLPFSRNLESRQYSRTTLYRLSALPVNRLLLQLYSLSALIFLGYALNASLTLLIALTGGVLGVLMMIPLRRYLIVKEHGNLRFPEEQHALKF